MAVCQPCVQVLTAAAVMAQTSSPAQPRSMTLMAGPIDTRINPTKVNELAMSKPIEWFEQQPDRHACRCAIAAPGAGSIRASCSSAAFMSMNIDRHRKAHLDLYENLANGEIEKAKATKTFYDEYFAVLDLAAEFYLETVPGCSRRRGWPRASSTYRGERVEPRAIRRTALLTVEGERDDICALGQTSAAHDLCQGLKPYMQPPPHAGGRRPLRRLLRQALGGAGLPDRAQHDPGERVSAERRGHDPSSGDMCLTRGRAIRV